MSKQAEMREVGALQYGGRGGDARLANRQGVDLGWFKGGKAVLLLAVMAIFAGWPMWHRGYGAPVHDARFHTLWHHNFSRQLWEGDLYPRWLMEMNGGLGSPAFYYYPPVPFYGSGVWRPLYGEEDTGRRALAAGAMLALFLSGLTAWGWLRRVASPGAALGGACAYMVAPYHLASDLYYRGAYAEFWAFVWLPLVMLGVETLRSSRRRGLLLLAFSYALLAATHLPTTLLFSWVPLLYAWLTGGRRKERWLALGQTVLGMIWGMGLAAVYLLPAMTLQGHVSMESLTASPNLQYQNNFLLSALHPGGEHFRAELFWQILGTFAVGACGFMMLGRTEDEVMRGRVWCGVVVLYATLFLMLPWSEPVWKYIPRLKQVQFPWRAATVLSLAACLLLAVGLDQWRRQPGTLQRVLVGAVVVLLTGWLWLDARAMSHYWRGAQGHNHGWMTRQEDASEYLPVWVVEPLGRVLESVEVNRDPAWARAYQAGALPLLPRAGIQDQARLAAVFTEGQGKVIIKEWQPRSITLDLDVVAAGTLQISRFYFPAWQAQLNLKPATLNPAPMTGLMQVEVPHGRHRLRLDLRLLPLEVFGWVITMLSFLAAVVVFLNLRHQPSHKP